MKERSSMRVAVVAMVLASALAGPGLSRAQSSPADRDSRQVLAAGNPALTKGMVTRFTDFFEWLIEEPLTQEQRERMASLVVGAWRQNSGSDIADVVEILKNEAQVAQLPDSQRALVLTQVQPEILKSLKADPNEEFNRWLLEMYNSAHVPIAAGNPPLTRQVSDAQAEMFAFMLGQASGQTVNADRLFKDDFARGVSRLYPTLSATQQAKWAQSPVIWASLRVIWSQLDEKDRSGLRKQWAEALGDALPKTRDRASLETALNDLSRLARVCQQRELNPAELDQGAKDLEEAARILRQDGGRDGSRQAASLEQSAAGLRRQAAELKSGSNAGLPAVNVGLAKKETVAEMMARAQSQHNMFMSMMNTSMQSYYSSINSMNTMSGSPYRYVNAYGNNY